MIKMIPYHKFLLLLSITLLLLGCAKTKSLTDASASQPTLSHEETVISWQQKLNEEYLSEDAGLSPLSESQRKIFGEAGGHPFYPIDEAFKVVAKMDRNVDETGVGFETSTDRVAIYDVYAIAHFQLEGKDYAVKIYQSPTMRRIPGYRDHLFFPFNDLTNGATTYGGGRYVDLTIPEGNELVIDFNQAYSPYCAYSDKYSCPVPPRENFINAEVQAGVKLLDKIVK